MAVSSSITPYADTPEAQALLRRFFEWVPNWDSGQRVLEIGAGAGHGTFEILQRVGPRGHVTVFEPNVDDFRRALGEFPLYMQKAIKYYSLPVQELVRVALESLEMEFDKGIWANGPHYLGTPEELQDFFKGMKICTPEVYVCSSFTAESVPTETSRMLGLMLMGAYEYLGVNRKEAPKPRAISTWSPRDYEEAAKSAGFTTFSYEMVPVELSREVYLGIAYDTTWLDNSLPPEGNLAEFSQEKRREALLAGTNKAYDRLAQSGKTATPRIWMFGRAS